MVRLEHLLPKEEFIKFSPTQVRIIESAIDVIALRGFASSSTAEIAKGAQVAEGTIFRYYKTKKDLLNEITQITIGKLIAPYLMLQFKQEILSQKTYVSFKEFVTKLAFNRIHFAEENLPLIKILLQEFSLHDEMKQQISHLFTKEIFPVVDGLMKIFIKNHEIKDLPTVNILRFIISNMVGVVMTQFIFKQKSDIDKEVNQTIDLIIDGLKYQ